MKPLICQSSEGPCGKSCDCSLGLIEFQRPCCSFRIHWKRKQYLPLPVDVVIGLSFRKQERFKIGDIWHILWTSVD